MIDILTKFSTEIQEWKKKWFEFYADNQRKITNCESIWDIFGSSISSIDDYINKINLIIHNLKQAQESIPKFEKHQTFKFKINQARTDVDKLDAQLTKLKEEKENLETKIKGFEDGSLGNFLICIKSQTRHEDFIKRQMSIDASIINIERSLKRKKKLFCKKQIELYKEYKKDELYRCQLLKKQSIAFLKSFDINSDDFNDLLKQYNPGKDFNQWEQEIFYHNANQSTQSQSPENEAPFDEDD